MKWKFNSNSAGPTQPGEAEKYDPVALLYKDRYVIAAGEVNTQMAYNLVAQIKKLELVNPDEPIKVLINSPGGSVLDGLAIYDIMREVKCKIITVGNGMQASMGSILLAGGDERVMTKNAMLLVHQIMGGAEQGTQHTSFEISASFMAAQHQRLKDIYVEFTGLNHKFWDIVGERDTWLTAEQAHKIGFIHHISQNEKPNGPYAADAKSEREDGLQAVLGKTVKEHISRMTAEEVARAINSGSAEGGVYARLRGELVVRLSEFPEYWTPTKKTEMEAKAKAANDNAGKEKPARAKKASGPTP